MKLQWTFDTTFAGSEPCGCSAAVASQYAVSTSYRAGAVIVVALERVASELVHREQKLRGRKPGGRARAKSDLAATNADADMTCGEHDRVGLPWRGHAVAAM
jgi:hypothetical protein